MNNMVKNYAIVKQNNHKKSNFQTSSKKGFEIHPKNQVIYEGIMVNELVLINQSFIEKILKKKIKRKLNRYLYLMINTLDDNSDSGESIRHALNDLSRYKDIIKYKYQKFLDQKYISLLLQKITVVEHELQQKLIQIYEPEEKVQGRSR